MVSSDPVDQIAGPQHPCIRQNHASFYLIKLDVVKIDAYPLAGIGHIDLLMVNLRITNLGFSACWIYLYHILCADLT